MRVTQRLGRKVSKLSEVITHIAFLPPQSSTAKERDTFLRGGGGRKKSYDIKLGRGLL